MKKVLIDTDNFLKPETCLKCPFLKISNYDPECKLLEYNVYDDIMMNTVHEYCPLKEVEVNENN